jgi:hypothetical protein
MNYPKRMLMWNKATGRELTVTCESELWGILRFAFGVNVALGKEYQHMDVPRREIRASECPDSARLGFVTWIDDIRDAEV